MTANTTSRFQVVDVAERMPGRCMITKNHVGPFIDTGSTFGMDDRLGFRGRAYIAVDVIREMADQAGIFEAYEAELTRLREGIVQFRDEAYREGYALGRAENFDSLADELVDRMRARVGGSRPERDVAADAGKDDPGPDGAAGSGAEAAVEQEPDGVHGAAAGDDGAGDGPGDDRGPVRPADAG